MKQNFEMVAKTFQGLEDVLAEELRNIGAKNVEPGLRMVSFEGDLETMYRANLACRTALRILKPIYKFTATTTDELYDRLKSFDWSEVLTLTQTFAIDPVVYSDIFTNSRFVTYRVKDAIVDYFKDKYGPDKRPGVRVTDSDVMLNVHIAEDRVTVSLDSSGESLHKRGYRVAQTEAPINEVLAAGILLKSGYRGDTPLVDPMCGSGTFLIEAALIAANIMPGIYRKRFAFEQWKDFDAELLDKIYNDDTEEREVAHPIIGADISPAAISVAERNIKSAGVNKYIDLSVKALQNWRRDEIPPEGILVMNPPYGERIAVEDMDHLYTTIGTTLKHVFLGYHAWIIAYREEYLRRIALAPSQKIQLLNGALPCELREYIMFDGLMSDFRKSGGRLKERNDDDSDSVAIRKNRGKDSRGDRRPGKFRDKDSRDFKRSKPDRKEGRGFGDRGDRSFDRKSADDNRFKRHREEPKNELERAYRPAKGRFADKKPRQRFDGGNRSEETPSENPLAQRRNEKALRSITGRKPSLAPKTGVIMRKRRNDNRE